ncbi:maleylpyruvate isomerase family mycothiol-dependent enzyme [Nocardia sp. CA2R105]|uniref:maleylpyruvate isomerase family mycothiol-dependent enzyme n=1 Tax=Nocardia coffeae TaxID=2873381 RepID=UPI001CA6470F|nr:maleylpyruvate isomerase family mycothiol-dependent enzyme [Nocardia coffeae]MBY8862318.1 maleylpyruvate isomerase family mycothiol-dependent enzyme [Nocardia coffeae]
MTEPIDVRERRELCDLMAELGPDAPTLCTGWTTLDLAAHLVLREHFQKWTDERMSIEKAKGLSVLIDRLYGGAPLVPWRLPRIRTVMNGVEYLIHHEDVRRANGHDRRLDRPDLEPIALRVLGFIGRRIAQRIAPHGLELRRPDGHSRRIGPVGEAVLTGEPTELLLYLTGRREAAQVSLTGRPDAIAALEKANQGF